MDDYHNTNNESGQRLIDSQSQAHHQQSLVLAHFQRHPGLHIAPHQVPMPEGTPITSVRRAITNLTTAGLLEKTDQMVPGQYPNHDVHTWRLVQHPDRWASVRERLLVRDRERSGALASGFVTSPAPHSLRHR